MYIVSVPDMNENVSRSTPERVYNEIIRFDAKRVFLALNWYETDEEKRARVFSELKRNCAYFKEKGLEVGVWICAFMLADSPYTCMKSLKGDDYPENMCPSDSDFLDFAASYAKEMALSGADMIMYDDDLRYGFLGEAPGCVCKNHLKMIENILGEEVTAELIREKVYNGSKNKYRDAYIKANGDAFRAFAKRMRQAVDEVNPHIRMGACSCMSSWDIDGVSAGELARIFAGGTRPFVRLIGAPYWVAVRGWGNSLQDVIELSRMESAWTSDGEIEIFSEGDAYPRPRTNCPAAYIEGFDTALRAAGCTEGILKYGIDYCSDIDYEKGYARYHERNRSLYEEIEKNFADKSAVGVRVYEYPEKLSDAVFTEEENIENMFFSYAARMLSYNTIPTVWQGEGFTGAVFGENARHLPLQLADKGLITDIRGAEILTGRGIDTGITAFGEGLTAGKFEIFTHNNNRILASGVRTYDISLKENARVLSFTEKDKRQIPISFFYENEKGQRFLIINAVYDVNNPNIFRHYERNRQLRDSVLFLSGKRLPLEITGHPALYMQLKENEKELAAGLWNFCTDICIEPEITVNGEYASVRYINCTGVYRDGVISLCDIPSYGFAGIILTKQEEN